MTGNKITKGEDRPEQNDRGKNDRGQNVMTRGEINRTEMTVVEIKGDKS
jgi:hypothetical protein